MVRKGKPAYTQIFAVYHRPNSKCEFFRVEENEGFYLVYCRVLERYLTRDAVIKCENFWDTCPYRKIGLQMGLEAGSRQ